MGVLEKTVRNQKNTLEKKTNKKNDIDIENNLEIVDEYIRKKYLNYLSEMQVAPINQIQDVKDDIIRNIRLFKVKEMAYQKGESAVDKFTTVFNTLAMYQVSTFMVMDSDGEKTSFYLGVRNNEVGESNKRRSDTSTLNQTLQQALIGHFPGVKIENGQDREIAIDLSRKIKNQHNVTSVSVVGNIKTQTELTGRQFVQGIEKLLAAMNGRPFMGIIIADSQEPQSIQMMRKYYQELYTNLSAQCKRHISITEGTSTSRGKTFAEMNTAEKAPLLAEVGMTVLGLGVGAFVGAQFGAMLGGQIAGQLNGIINLAIPHEQIGTNNAYSESFETENKAVSDMMKTIDELINKSNEYDSYGLWNVAGYFMSDNMATAEIAANNYRALMNGENSGREVSCINCWSKKSGKEEDFNTFTTYLSRFVHPQFLYGKGFLVNATTAVSGKELGLHLGLPRRSVPGLPVIEHAEFGREATVYRLIQKGENNRPEDKILLGKLYDLGRKTEKTVELNAKTLNMHTFITGSTGSGKSNAVYQILSELKQNNIPFLVIEPAKGEYKDAFGSLPDVRVFSTNPNVAPLIKINPFKFPSSIHILEHVDGLVEIFSVCWPMYDAMPAFFKNAILNSYEAIGWDLGTSTFDGDELEYPDFEIVAEQLNKLIDNSEYAPEVKSNYRGALLTRVSSLTVGLNKYIFTEPQIPYKEMFDENCILDISRVKSTETKALIMGIMVYSLNEYRMDQKHENNQELRHITVLEEAHNLLKRGPLESSELVGKSVEMLTNTIAEIRTYGEGFIIVDQSPSSVDIAAIKNTNTKIILRTPEINDRETVGKSIGLNEDQVDEIAKLPSGVAIVYQNDWLCPVLALVEKANIVEVPYRYEQIEKIKPLKRARTEILSMLLQPWLEREPLSGKELKESLRALDLPRKEKLQIRDYIDDYIFCGRRQIWRIEDIPKVQELTRDVLGISRQEFATAVYSGNQHELVKLVKEKVIELTMQEINEVCNVLTKVVESNNECNEV